MRSEVDQAATSTVAICDECGAYVPATVVIGETDVRLQKDCRQHGLGEAVVCSDSVWFRAAIRTESRSFRPLALIVEVIDGCNMRCPTCIAGTEPAMGNARPVAAIAASVSAALARYPTIKSVFLSGGEPTIHPELMSIVSAILSTNIDHLFVITNGLKIASSPTLCRKLREAGDHRLEIYLQFDSLRSEALVDLRGEDLREVRARSLLNLGAFGIPCSLVCVIKPGLNADEVPELVDHAQSYPHVRGITFQPIREAGRTTGYDRALHQIDLPTVCRQLSGSRRGTLLSPHAMNPLGVAVAYFDRTPQGLDPAKLVIGAADHVFAPPSDRDLFRIAVVEYADPHTWWRARSDWSIVGILAADRSVVPAEEYFVLGRRAPSGRPVELIRKSS